MGDSDLVVIFSTHSDDRGQRRPRPARGPRRPLGHRASSVPHPMSPVTVGGLGDVRLSVDRKDADEATPDHRERTAATPGGGSSTAAGPGSRRSRAGSGTGFRDRDLLECALTHRSRANEDETGAVPDNESLEFLGDSVLGFLVAERLYREFPGVRRGRRSRR